jgi:hypothetical protein
VGSGGAADIGGTGRQDGTDAQGAGETAADERANRRLLYLSLYPCRKRPFRPFVPSLAPHQADPRLSEHEVPPGAPSTGGFSRHLKSNRSYLKAMPTVDRWRRLLRRK